MESVMNINYDKVLLAGRMGNSRGHQILKKLSNEFQIAYTLNDGFRFNTKCSNYDFPTTMVKQKALKYPEIGFENLLDYPLFEENQSQLNAAFSWIAMFEFFNGDVVSFYLNAENFDKHFKNPNVFQVKPFSPPALPSKISQDKKHVSLATISIDYLKHLYAQENLFTQNCGKINAGK